MSVAISVSQTNARIPGTPSRARAQVSCRALPSASTAAEK